MEEERGEEGGEEWKEEKGTEERKSWGMDVNE